MNRSNDANLSDRTAAMTWSFASAFVVGGFFAVAALTACQPHRATVGHSVEVSGSTAASPTDASLDTQLRLEPGEIQLYTQNIHG